MTRTIDPITLRSWLNDGQPLALFDVREHGQHGEGHPFFAVPLPYSRLELEISRLAPRRAERIVLFDDGEAGDTVALRAAQRLAALGYHNVTLLGGGTRAWAAAGYTLFKGLNVPSKTFGELVEQIQRTPRLSAADLAARRAAGAPFLLVDSRTFEEPRFGLPALSAAEAQQWLDDEARTTYLFDIRTAEEFARGTIAGALHAPGGQLVQATDRYIGVRGSRVIVFDDDRVRAPVIASWLHQLGYQSAVLADGVQASLKLPIRASSLPARGLPVLDASLLRALLTENASATRIDLRESAEYHRSHARGAAWSIRPRLLARLDELGVAHDQPVILIAGEPEVAILAGRDLLEAGYRHVYRTAEGYRTWQAAGLPVETAPTHLAREERIDYLFFLHDRHEGNPDAARAYLAWETGLIAQCAEDELGVFRIPAPAGPCRSGVRAA